jgi:hypothetical protein
MAGPWYPKVVYSRGSVLVDGFVAAGWWVQRTKGASTLHVDLFTDLAPAVRDAVEAEATSLLAFLDAAADERKVLLERYEL